MNNSVKINYKRERISRRRLLEKLLANDIKTMEKASFMEMLLEPEEYRKIWEDIDRRRGKIYKINFFLYKHGHGQIGGGNRRKKCYRLPF